MPWRRTPGRVAAALAILCLIAYLSNGPALPGNDAKASAYTSVSLLRDGDLVFSPFEAPFMFRWEIDTGSGRKPLRFTSWGDRLGSAGPSAAELFASGRLHYAQHAAGYLVPTLRSRQGQPLFANTFGPAPGLTALPAALVAASLGVDLARDHEAVWMLAKLTAALLVAASAAFVYLSAAQFTSGPRALLLAAAYATGTCVWSLSSQTLWQQTPTLFFLSLGVLCMVRGRGPWTAGALAGLAFSAAFVCRPTAALVLAAAAGHLWLAERRSFLPFLIAAAPLVLLFAFYNLHYFGSPFHAGQLATGKLLAELKTGSPDPWQTPLWLGAAGLLFSPSRGLLVYSPFLAAAFAGAVLVWMRPELLRLRFVALAAAGLWLPAFAWFDWWGGWAYGYRPIVDSTPLLAVLCVPVLDWLLERPAWRAALLLSIGWSVLVQVVGAFAYSPPAWNARVVDASGQRADIDLPQHRHRLWSFRDWQIGYLIQTFPQSAAERMKFARTWAAQPFN